MVPLIRQKKYRNIIIAVITITIIIIATETKTETEVIPIQPNNKRFLTTEKRISGR